MAELLSHVEIADVINAGLGSVVGFGPVSKQDWQAKLEAEDAAFVAREKHCRRCDFVGTSQPIGTGAIREGHRGAERGSAAVHP